MMWMMRCYGRGDWWQWNNIMRRESVDLQMQNNEQSNATVKQPFLLGFIHTRFKKFCSGLDKNSYTLLNTIVFKCYELLLKFCLLLWLFFCNARRQRQWRHHHRRVVCLPNILVRAGMRPGGFYSHVFGPAARISCLIFCTVNIINSSRSTID